MTDDNNQDKNDKQDEKTQPTTETGNPAGKQGESTKDGSDMVNMSQKAFDAIIADRVQRAKSSAVSEYNELLGVDNKDQALTVLEADRKAKEAEMSELERVQSQRDILQSNHNQTIVAYNLVLIEREVMLNLPEGFPNDRLEDLLKLVDLSSMKIEDGKVTGVESELKRVFEKSPYLLYEEKGNGRLGDQGTSTEKSDKVKRELDRVNRDDKKEREKKPKFRM